MEKVIEINGLKFIKRKSCVSCDGCFFRNSKSCPGIDYCMKDFETYILIPLEL